MDPNFQRDIQVVCFFSRNNWNLLKHEIVCVCVCFFLGSEGTFDAIASSKIQKKYDVIISKVVVSDIFLFSPLLGEMIQFD